ncbi:MAG TPA: Gfo/Idh/MocA family oxidoreductase [Acidobacteriota bacterium]|jgi:predicted dehydrogenase|nr:Gfo/Idh/MocA family oxidoreductase [Acidobacteriota bacterium]
MTVKPTLKVAVVGVGALGSHHARIYQQLPNLELVGVVDILPDRAQEVAARYGCAAYTDFRCIIGKVDAISLAVPTERHADIGVECLGAGIHVLVEKPIASSLAGAQELVAAAARNGRILQVGQSERFNPALQAVIPFLKRPLFFEAHRLGVFVPRSLDIDVVLDLMIHDLDLVLRLSGSRVREIRAVGIPVLTPRIDIANARLELENGCVANVTASRVSREKVRKFRFFQPHDYVSLDFFQQEVEMYSLIDGPSGKRVEERTLTITKGEPLKLEIEAFLRQVRGESLPGDDFSICTGEQGKEALELALKILEAADRG